MVKAIVKSSTKEVLEDDLTAPARDFGYAGRACSRGSCGINDDMQRSTNAGGTPSRMLPKGLEGSKDSPAPEP